MIPYKSPAHGTGAFNCPLCNAFAEMTWSITQYPHNRGQITGLETSECRHCKKLLIWYHDKMVFPYAVTAPRANLDLPDDIKEDFEEARRIHTYSPRGTAALLRLCIQKLCIHLDEKGKNLNTDIKNLVKKGLPPKVQEALDIVRVIGNEAVHPGVLDLRDDNETVGHLFKLVNLVADKMITEPKEVDALYDQLPQTKKNEIENRDKDEK